MTPTCRMLTFLVYSYSLIMLRELKSVGLDEHDIECFRSYLTGQAQLTQVAHKQSDSMAIKVELPQRSIL